MTDVITAITSCWTAVATWFIETFNLVPAIFYAKETGLTFIGTLAVFGAGFGIITGLIYMIRGWVRHSR